MERHFETVKRNAAKPMCDQASLLSFDVLRFSFVPRLHYWMDGKPGKRTLFIEDEEDNLFGGYINTKLEEKRYFDIFKQLTKK